MSLRRQIIVRILISTLCMLALGGALAVWQARQSVQKEVDASIHLALQLITLGMTDAPLFQQAEDLAHFRALRQTRHLSIEVRKPDGQLLHFAGDSQPSQPEQMPPAWFIKLVRGDYPQVAHQLKTRDGQTLTLIITAQPLDEITEVWQESLAFFASIFLLTLLTFFAVNIVFNNSLNSIDVIVNALRELENGRYRQQLPAFAVREFDSIAKAVNHLMLELEKTRRENRDLTRHTLAIQEDERQRLSRELHDEFGQSLTAIKVMAAAAARRPAEITEIAGSISGICDHLTTVVRGMMRQLQPLMLGELGLKATLEDMVDQWSERHAGPLLSIHCAEEVDAIDKNTLVQLFRVIQECLTNVARHARAQRVRIDLELADDPEPCLRLIVADDGCGCDPRTAASGFGLPGMRERIKSLGGEIIFASQPGQGMTITAWAPVK